MQDKANASKKKKLRSSLNMNQLKYDNIYYGGVVCVLLYHYIIIIITISS